jgi:hypothetical protein
MYRLLAISLAIRSQHTAKKSEDRLLTDGRVPHPLRAELLQQADGGLEDPAGRGHVLAEEDHPVVPAHLLRDPAGHRLAVCDHSHDNSHPPAA